MYTRKLIPILFAFVLSLSLQACELLNQEGAGDEKVELSVSVQNGNVKFTKSYQFVTVTANGDWALSIRYEDETVEPWASLSAESGTGTKNNIILSYSNNGGEDARSLTLVVVSGEESASCTMVQAASGSTGGNIDQNGDNNGVAQANRGWMELPATCESDGLDWYYHDMTYPQGGKDRNYSYYWDYDNLVSVWVAYPLNKALMGSGSRTNAWDLDPNMPREQQSVTHEKGFRPTGLDRGHQCPSADRLLNSSANGQTFYGTNMTPQLSNFNQNIWASLESKVRTWAGSCDTLYVVTGCVVAPNSTDGEYGEVGGYASDNDGKRVAIPLGYYKAVLRYNKNQDYGYAGYSACAIYLDHRNYGSNESVGKADGLSIDELEEITGIDFFVNLPMAVGAETAAKIEAQNPQNVQIWW